MKNLQSIIEKIQKTPLKYRVWQNGKMYDADLMYWSVKSCVPNGFYDFYAMQATGLFDKNGKGIFVGDIIEIPYYIIGDEPAYYTKKVVEFHNGVFGVWERYLEFMPLSETEKNDETSKEYISNRGTIYNKKNPTVEVIGNIFENPELLETK